MVRRSKKGLTKGAFGGPKWKRAKIVEPDPIPEIKAAPPGKLSWWRRLWRYIWRRP